MKHTKIIATLGPVSGSRGMIRELALAGADVFRLNFSHGDPEWRTEVIQSIRQASEELDRPIAILADLQGPRIRTEVTFPIDVKRGFSLRVCELSERIRFSTDDPVVALDTPGILGRVAVGHRILVEDGLIGLTVTKIATGYVEAQAENDGTIKNRKGVILPDTLLDLPILSKKDKEDLAFILREGLEYVGLSFVGSVADIESVRREMDVVAGPAAKKPLICSKIERKAALRALREIIRASDCAMVARGDLGIEMPESEIAILQKQIIAESLREVRPVIVATQMMQSMVANPRPTRAEVSDVSNAVIDHADAVMLSEETAAGKYPVETVATMREIIEKTEESPFDDIYQALDLNLKTEYAVMVRSVYELSQSFRVKAILILSMSGFTARLLSHFRPDARLLVATNSVETWRQLALVWGVEPYLFAGDKNLDTLIERFMHDLKSRGILMPDDQVAVFYGRTPEQSTMKLVGIRTIH
ncbi:MAG: pyruvate kinase [Candidatus Moraniibacteriota bacterium]|nr:MAG: pyruvate kinase [Candidatus Moranbacteria bacterium]